MRYKLIKSMAHNWTHSFMSGMNYLDGGFIFEDMHKLARDRKGDKVTITWIPERPEELLGLTSRVQESIKNYCKALPQHLARHEVDPATISEMRTEVYVTESYRICVRSYVLDDRGKEHVQFVWA